MSTAVAKPSSPTTVTSSPKKSIISSPEVLGNPFKALEVVADGLRQRSVSSTGRVSSSSCQGSLGGVAGVGQPLGAKPPRRRVVSTSAHARRHERFEQKPLFMAVAGYISYAFLFIVGYIREFLWGTGPLGKGVKRITERGREGYAPLYASFESFYTRNVYRRLKDVFNRPICSAPAGQISLVGRTSDDHFWTWKLDEKDVKEDCVNLASYNYLGFAENAGTCTVQTTSEVPRTGLTFSSCRQEMGQHAIHKELEETVAEFLGVEAAMTVGMGFATNSLNLPRLMGGPNTLVLSDEKNHASLILGLRLSGATVRIFKHNSSDSLEKALRWNLIHGHPRSRRPFKKVFVVVEGIYSMEGSIVCLPQILALKKKYKFYVYLDEAHSIGAMGPRGRGVVDYFNLNPKDVDIMMGTFTKSFGSAGGYIAGSKKLIDFLKVNSQASAYAMSMCGPVARQIISSMRVIMDQQDGAKRIKTLARNARYFRQRLQQMGCIVYGHDDSPVVPLMLFVPAKIPALVNGLLQRGIASVGVGFPATEMAEERARFCLSAAHDKEMLDAALAAIDDVAGHIHVKYSRKNKYQLADIVY